MQKHNVVGGGSKTSSWTNRCNFKKIKALWDCLSDGAGILTVCNDLIFVESRIHSVICALLANRHILIRWLAVR